MTIGDAPGQPLAGLLEQVHGRRPQQQELASRLARLDPPINEPAQYLEQTRGALYLVDDGELPAPGAQIATRVREPLKVRRVLPIQVHRARGGRTGAGQRGLAHLAGTEQRDRRTSWSSGSTGGRAVRISIETPGTRRGRRFRPTSPLADRRVVHAEEVRDLLHGVNAGPKDPRHRLATLRKGGGKCGEGCISQRMPLRAGDFSQPVEGRRSGGVAFGKAVATEEDLVAQALPHARLTHPVGGEGALANLSRGAVRPATDREPEQPANSRDLAGHG